MSKEVFVRKATGLTRPFGVYDTLIIAIGAINLGSGTLLVYSSSLAFAPGYNYVLSLFIAMVLNLFVVLTYAMITIAMPRSGGDYVFVSRTINPTLGFANNFFWTVISILGIAWNCLFMAGTAVSTSLTVGGATLNSNYLTSLGQAANQPIWGFVIGTVTMLFIMVLMIVQVKWLKIVNLITFVIGMITVVAWIVVLGITPLSSFIASFNTFAQPYTNSTNSYQMIIQSAHSNGMTLAVNWNAVLAGTVLTLPISYFTLGGANVVNFFSGEIKEVSKTAIWSTIGALVAIFVFDALIGVVLFSAAGYEFMSALSYLAFNVPSSYTLPVSPFLPLIVDIAVPNIGMVVLTLLGMISWLYLLAMSYYLIATRNMFAWSFDGVIPTWFSEINAKYHTPVRSVITITLFAIFGIAFYELIFPVAFSYSNFTTGYNTAWLVACASGAAFPFIKKETFEAQPPFVKKRFAGVPAITIFGILGALSVIAMDVFVVLNPSYAGIPANLSNISLVILGLIFVIGLIFFVAARAIQKSRGLDLSLVFKEIPPS
ncbi:MAG TPA: APC family permease [Candidatus Bathyarchaeia archaeon]|nr:APC family permease [Candidatus Bathyarchaeia archaeon]